MEQYTLVFFDLSLALFKKYELALPLVFQIIYLHI